MRVADPRPSERRAVVSNSPEGDSPDRLAVSRTIVCRAALFDMDGTLVDSGEMANQLWRDWAASMGVDPAPILAVHHGCRPEETLRQTYPQFATPEIAAAIQASGEGKTAGLQPIAGAAALLDSLKQLPWAIVTSATRPLAEARLRAAGLWRGVPMISAESVSAGKPSPEGYLAGARMLGVPPEECVVFEDAPAGIEAGRRAGMTVIGITSTHQPDELATPYRIADMTGLMVESRADGSVRLQFVDRNAR